MKFKTINYKFAIYQTIYNGNTLYEGTFQDFREAGTMQFILGCEDLQNLLLKANYFLQGIIKNTYKDDYPEPMKYNDFRTKLKEWTYFKNKKLIGIINIPTVIEIK